MKSLPLFVFVLLTILTTSAPAMAEGLSGSTLSRESQLNPNNNGIAQRGVEGDFLVKQHCTKCHSESRIMDALKSMHSSRDENYKKDVQNIISRKIRLTNGDISRQDGRKIIEYLVAVWQNHKSEGKTAS